MSWYSTFIPKPSYAFCAIVYPILPTPMIPRERPLELYAMPCWCLCACFHCSTSPDLAASAPRIKFSKTERTRQIAISATASKDARAPLQYVMLCLDNVGMSAQTYPATTEAKILHVLGRWGTRSSSHFPVSTPEFQNGRKMAWKSPPLRCSSAVMKASLRRCSKVGCMVLNRTLRLPY